MARLLGEVIVEVRNGELTPAVGNAVASLSRALLGAIESGNVAERVEGLEELLNRLSETINMRAAS